MCGICGWIGFNGRRAEIGAIQKMSEVMGKRGPDGQGMHLQGNIALGHRRLKIIDLSERAHQPMVDNMLGLNIVFNGCIYNYPELRTQLESQGYRFFSNGDTEVILKAYHHWGPECLKRFNGMFAFAIAERDSGKLFLARDRLGIKPLYYSVNAKRLAFASSLPALVAAGDIDTRIDPAALNCYLSFHSVVPAPNTILKGVSKLAPANWMAIQPDGQKHQECYWRLNFGEAPQGPELSFSEWQERLLEEIRNAVKRRLTADVPVGVLLSGGVDSSLVVGLLAQSGQKDLNTFSIGFESVGGEAGDEFQYSDLIADTFQTVHHKIEVDAARVLPALAGCVAAMNEPMVSHDCIGFYLLSQEVAKSVKVVQSGQGADEIFGGYHWYPPLMESADPLGDYSKVFFDRDHPEYRRTVASALVGQDYAREFVKTHFRIPGAESAIDKALRLDTTVMLVDDPVKRVDNMTMAWGLEARVPFLDHELVEFAAAIPPEYKIAQGGKHILKEASRDVIPDAVIDRPKGYFPVPALKYLRGAYLDFVKQQVNSPAARERQLFNSEYVETLLKEPEAHITPLKGSKLWQIALLTYWLEIHQF